MQTRKLPPSSYMASALIAAAMLFGSTADARESSLKHFIARAEETNTAAMALVHDGIRVANFGSDSTGPIDLRGATKSVVAFGVGLLLRDGLIQSLDTPVHLFFPEWNQGRKKLITLRMLLDETSGLPDAPEIPIPDVVRFALAAELQSDPGQAFSESDFSADLLMAIVTKLAGKAADEYFAEALFAPLGIHEVTWQKDDAGNVLGATGLAMSAGDAVAVGELVLGSGVWNGKEIVPESFVKEMLNPQTSKSIEYGLLWTRSPAWIRLSVDEASLELLRKLSISQPAIAKVATLKGRTFENSEALVASLHKVLSDEEFDNLYRSAETRAIRMGTIFHLELGPMAAFSASGDGQFIVVVPSANTVAVRQSITADDQYDDFVERVLDVARGWTPSLRR